MLSPICCCSDSFQFQCGRRLALLGAAGSIPPTQVSVIPSSSSSDNGVDLTITDRVFMDVGICPTSERPACSDPQSLGRIVIGLYGKQVPQTTRLFKAMCTGSAGSSYQGTVFHRVVNGKFIQAGRQGARDIGEVRPPHDAPENLDSLNPAAFLLGHNKPGTVSLCLDENDDEDVIRLDPEYRNVEFLITTGSDPDLDRKNLVFGSVLQGMDVVGAIAELPTFKPSNRAREFNKLAEILGDDRAANARNAWFRPVKPVVITECGIA